MTSKKSRGRKRLQINICSNISDETYYELLKKQAKAEN